MRCYGPPLLSSPYKVIFTFNFVCNSSQVTCLLQCIITSVTDNLSNISGSSVPSEYGLSMVFVLDDGVLTVVL